MSDKDLKDGDSATEAGEQATQTDGTDDAKNDAVPQSVSFDIVFDDEDSTEEADAQGEAADDFFSTPLDRRPERVTSRRPGRPCGRPRAAQVVSHVLAQPCHHHEPQVGPSCARQYVDGVLRGRIVCGEGPRR